jgi:hypothetical protein
MPGATSGEKPQWHGVKHIQHSSIGFGYVSIGSGMKDKVPRFTAVSFGLLAFVMLGLSVLDHL